MHILAQSAQLLASPYLHLGYLSANGDSVLSSPIVGVPGHSSFFAMGLTILCLGGILLLSTFRDEALFKHPLYKAIGFITTCAGATICLGFVPLALSVVLLGMILTAVVITRKRRQSRRRQFPRSAKPSPGRADAYVGR